MAGEIIPFGKYKDRYIEEIPSYYLLWIAENLSEKNLFEKRLIKACDDEWQWREKNNCHISKEDFDG